MVVLLSVTIAVLVGTLGVFGFGWVDGEGYRTVDATVVTGQPCDPAGAEEIVTFTVDGRDRQATFDGCGHQPDEPVRVALPAELDVPDLLVRAADATTGEGNNGRRLGLLLLAVAGVAGGGYGLLLLRGRKGNPVPLLGRFQPVDLGRLLTGRTR